LQAARQWGSRRVSKVFDTDTAPEIEHRTQCAALRYFDLPVPERYRAPHAKVRELHRLGLTQKQIAQKLKVKERTIRNRLSELPPEPPREITAFDLLKRQMERGTVRGGRFIKPKFWLGDSIPRGHSAAAPCDIAQQATRYNPKEYYTGERCFRRKYDDPPKGMEHASTLEELETFLADLARKVSPVISDRF
jgi:hypothetical protein